MVQVRPPDNAGSPELLRFGDGTEVIVTAHVTKEGPLEVDGPGSVRQRVEVETEQITRANQTLSVKSGLRVTVYQQQPKDEPGATASAAPVHFTYGERLQFPAKISSPRNYRNPGAFDYQGYLAENGIVALASTKTARVEVLPGFAGRRAEFWRSRIYRSIIDKVHALWPPQEAALMDAMVIGEDAFINRPSGPTFSARALTTCWWFRG